MVVTIIILIILGAFLAWGKFRSDIVTMLALMSLTVLDILTPQEAIAGFSNPVVLMLAGMFIVAGGVNQTGLASPYATPPNSLVLSPGHYTFGDFIRVGLSLQLISLS